MCLDILLRAGVTGQGQVGRQLSSLCCELSTLVTYNLTFYHTSHNFFWKVISPAAPGVYTADRPFYWNKIDV